MARLLIVEDEEHLSEALKLNFEAEGHEVAVSPDGLQAIDEFRKGREAGTPFDLVVLDLMLPQRSGYEVCQSIRENDRDLPVLILSARSMVEDRVHAFDVGADQFLQKPFSLAELLSRIRNLLARGERRRSSGSRIPLDGPVRIGRADVDFRSHEVSVGGTPQKLSALHLQVLKLLVENDGVVLTREEILERAWGSSSAPSTSRVVDNAVLALRKIIEDDPASPRHLRSVRGAGYKFVGDPKAHPEADEANGDASA